jgi:hypothetical protein
MGLSNWKSLQSFSLGNSFKRQIIYTMDYISGMYVVFWETKQLKVSAYYRNTEIRDDIRNIHANANNLQII